MKNEINDIEYVQAPTISSTRKFDLNTPFSLVPESFDKSTGKKRSLLIGCNYHGTEGAELKASHDDIRSMKDYIVNVHGFPETDDMMTILLDDKEHKSPTFTTLLKRLSHFPSKVNLEILSLFNLQDMVVVSLTLPLIIMWKVTMK